MQGHSEKNSAAMLSLAAATLLTLVKLGVGLYTNSLGILSEALHSGLDLVAALMTLFAVRMAAQPADRNHPYGHGKAENLSALGETLLLLLTSVWIMVEAYDRLVSGGAPVLPSLWGVGVMALSITIDINRARMLHKVAKKFKSQALEADALHFWSDIWSSGVVLAGVLAVWCGSWLPETSPVRPFLNSADAVAALLVSLIILKSCFSMARRAINALMDGGGEEHEEEIRQKVAALPGITSVRQVRVRTSGPYSFVDMTVGVEPGLRVETGHALAHQAEQTVAVLMPEADVTVHVEPCGGSPSTDPFFIIQRLAIEQGMPVHSLQVTREGGCLHAELHVEMDGAMPLMAAHARVAMFERKLRACLPELDVVTHIEPEQGREEMNRVSLTHEEAAPLIYAVEQLVGMTEGITRCHRVTAYRCGDAQAGLSLSFHCCMTEDCTVAHAHAVAAELEAALRRSLPQLRRIVIHMEPPSSAVAGG
ncbi:MAG: cation-efflux pump [Desulfovibrionaceae bacterium]